MMMSWGTLVYRAGTEGIFMQIAANAYGEYSGHFLHNDTTPMSLQGEYEHEEGVKQRWVVVFSEKAFARETKTLEKKIKKENIEGNAEKRGSSSSLQTSWTAGN